MNTEQLPGNYFSVHPDTVHVDNWNVDEDNIFHKHPEYGEVSAFPEEGYAELEWGVEQGKCSLCKVAVPGHIVFLNRLYNL